MLDIRTQIVNIVRKVVTGQLLSHRENVNNTLLIALTTHVIIVTLKRGSQWW